MITEMHLSKMDHLHLFIVYYIPIIVVSYIDIHINM